MHFITRKYTRSDFTFPINLDEKITIFEDMILGWQLEIAEQLINGYKDENNNAYSGIPHSGFAALTIILSYFEMIGKYEAGYIGKQSAKYFKKGTKSVFSSLKDAYNKKVQAMMKAFLIQFYKKARCNLYHLGFTGKEIVLTGELKKDFKIQLNTDLQPELIIINPHKLTKSLILHFKSYIKKLQDINEVKLRENFEKRFDFDTQ